QGNRTVSIQGNPGDSSTMNISVLNNTVIAGTAGNNQGNQGIEIAGAGTSTTVFAVDGNKVGTDGVTNQPLINTSINVFNGGTTSSMTGTVKNNAVVNAGAGQSGFGIRVFNFGNSSMNAKVSGNTVSNVGLDFGMLVESSG